MIFRSRGELMPLQVLIGLPVVLFSGVEFSWLWCLATLLVYIAFNVALIEAYLHRYVTHRAYELHPVVDGVLAYLAAVVPATGSPIGWCAIHSAHHRHSDTDKDPHSIHHNSFLGLIFWKYNYTGTIKSSRHTFSTWHKLLHRYYVLFMASWLISWWMVSLDAAIYIVIIPWILGPLFSTIQNVFLHYRLPFCYRNFETDDSSQNSPLMHVLSFGACGLHNNHHANPNLKDCRVQPDEHIDSAYWFIKLIEKGA